jgi:hypothetical protein
MQEATFPARKGSRGFTSASGDLNLGTWNAALGWTRTKLIVQCGRERLQSTKTRTIYFLYPKRSLVRGDHHASNMHPVVAGVGIKHILIIAQNMTRRRTPFFVIIF